MGVASCPDCQQATVARANFCHACGKMLAPYCRECRLNLPENASFCFQCGSEISSEHRKTLPQAVQSRPFIQEAKGPNLAPSPQKKIQARREEASESQRKLVTILFADLKGFTSLSEKLDPEKVTDIVNECFKELGQVIVENEGFIDKFMGDCVMALFGAPVAHENDPELAVDCALKILKKLEEINKRLDLDLGISIGVNSGNVIAGNVGTENKQEYTVMGDAVNVAQRLQSHAGRNEILVSSSVRRSCGQTFGFRSIGPIKAKGKDAPIDAFLVEGKGEVETYQSSVPLRLIGRQKELQLINGLLDEINLGRGQIVVISGEPGVGKSRLKHEMKKMTLAKNLKWVETKCTLLSKDSSYSPFLGLLMQVLHIDPKQNLDEQRENIKILDHLGLDQASSGIIRELLNIQLPEDKPLNLPAGQRKTAIFVAIKNLFLSFIKQNASVYYFEDIHWMDPISMELIEYLFDSISDQKLMIACAVRQDFQMTWHQRSFLNRISLHPLTSDQSVELACDILQIEKLPARLEGIVRNKADGNPLFIEEIIKNLVESEKLFRRSSRWIVREDATDADIPPTIQGLISSRIDRLNEREKKLLQFASVIGRRFHVSLLQECIDDQSQLDDYLKTLQRKELIFETGQTSDRHYVFKHALVQEVAYGSILQKTRKSLHQAVADTIEKQSPKQVEELRDEDLESLAHHFQQGENWDKSIFYLIESGKRLAINFNNQGAIKHYLTALELTKKIEENFPDHRHPRKIDLHSQLSQVYRLIGDYEEAEAQEMCLLKIAEALNDLVQIARSYRRLGDIDYQRGAFEKALEHLHTSLDYSVKSGDEEGQIATFKFLANCWKKKSEFSKALELFEKGLEGAKHIGKQDLVAQYLNDRATLLIELQRLDDAKADLEASIQISSGISTMKPLLITSTLNLGVVQYFKKDVQGALDTFRKTAHMAAQIGQLTNQLIAKHNIGEMLVEYENYEDALNEFEDAFMIARDMGNQFERINNLILTGFMKVKLNQLESGKEILFEGIQEATKRQYWSHLATAYLYLSECHLRLNDFSQAQESLKTSKQMATDKNLSGVLGKIEIFEAEHQDLKKAMPS